MSPIPSSSLAYIPFYPTFHFLNGSILNKDNQSEMKTTSFRFKILLLYRQAIWFCVLQANAVARLSSITPAQAKRSPGYGLASLFELRSSSTRYGVEDGDGLLYPGLRSACAGVIEIIRRTA
jgi:hypothetical protein